MKSIYIILYIILMSGCQIKTISAVQNDRAQARIKELENYISELEIENRSWQDACMGKVPALPK